MRHELTVPVLTATGATEWRLLELDKPMDLAGLLAEYYTAVHLWDEDTDTYVVTLPEVHPVLPYAYFRAGGWHAFTSDINYSAGYRRVLELTDLALAVAKLRRYRKGDARVDVE
jgi:hypothetical protein